MYSCEKMYENNFGTEITASVLMDNEILIILKSGEFVILNGIDFSEKKRFKFENIAPVYKVNYKHGLIYFGGADAKFYCIKPDGSIVWIHEFQNTISEFFFSDLGIENKQFVLICAYDKTFRVLDAITGDYFWAQMTGLGIESSAFGYDTYGNIDSVFICSDDGTVRKLNPKNGEMTAYFESPKVIRTLYADFRNGIVLAGGDEMLLYILDYHKLTIKTTIPFDTYIWDIIPYKNNPIIQLYSFAFLGELLEETGDPGLIFFELLSNQLNECSRLMKLNIQSKQIIDGLLFAGTTDGEIAIIDLVQKRLIISEKIGGFINSIFVMKKDNYRWILGSCEENGDLKVFGVNKAAQ